MDKIWFVHDIVPLNEKTDLARLFYVQETDLYDGQESIVKTLFTEVSKGYDKCVGTFVKIENNDMVPANTYPLAKKAFFLSNIYRGKLLNRYEENETDMKQGISIKYSYHVNVGHGNCSIVVAKSEEQYQIWMIDCSNYDYLNRQEYTPNIEKAISYIVSKFKLPNFKIAKFFLTHYHYDHYSGINWLMSHDYLSNAEIWMNFHYSWPEPKFIRLLKSLNSLKCLFREPKVSNSTNVINIWYPTETIVRSLTQKYFNLRNIRQENNPNNSSAVIQLGTKNQSIVFPGDIETSGLNRITKCKGYLNNAKFYCISHHGSQNGHERTNCPLGRRLSNMSDCCSRISKAILMGREGAYSGIYASQVIQDFGGKIVFSERDDNNCQVAFVEIDLSTSNVIYPP